MTEINPELLRKYFQDQCTPEEKAIVEKWFLSSGPEIQDQMTRETLAKVAREDLKGKIWEKLNPEARPAPGRIRRMFFRYAAASVVILAAVFYFLTYKDKPLKEEKLAAEAVQLHTITTRPGERLRVALPDGSIVYVNSGSKLTFPYRFEEGRRQVAVSGEAFFEVVKDPDRPFVVKLPGASRLQVLGTSFNVAAYEKEKVLVSVRTGLVRLTDQSGKELLVAANQSGTLFTSEENLVLTQISSDASWGWKDNRLVFEDHTLAQIGVMLERWYGISVTIAGPGLADRRFTGSYDNPSLEKLLDDMGRVMHFRHRFPADKALELY